jgi:hypothetical protein
MRTRYDVFSHELTHNLVKGHGLSFVKHYSEVLRSTFGSLMLYMREEDLEPHQ